MDISVIIPAYNEEMRLEVTLERILSFVTGKGYNHEIIVVDDGSWDGTVSVAQSFRERGVRVLRNDRNRGKGYAVRSGMLNARMNLVLYSDADLSTPIEELEKLAALVLTGKVQIAIGSRAVVGSQIEISQPAYRIAMGKVFNLLVRVIALGGIHDTQCGFKLFTREAAQEVFRRQTLHGFGFDVEILFIARRLGLQIAEVPIRWMDSSASKVNAIRDSWVMLQDLFRVRWNDHAGRYR